MSIRRYYHELHTIKLAERYISLGDSAENIAGPPHINAERYEAALKYVSNFVR